MTTRLVWMLLAAVVAAALGPRSAFAYPEMVRRGYGNCTSCHVSPSGGGTLTEYGRELSLEALSYAGTENEAEYLYDLVKPPEWLLGGGDIRYLQNFVNTPFVFSGRGIWMQADSEAALNFDKFAVDGTVGLDEFGNFISRRHYVIYRPIDNFSLRAGKFLPAYGIGFPYHYLEVREGLAFNDVSFPNTGESYNVEGAYIGENVNFYATGIFGRPDDPSLDHETGFSAVASYFFSDRYKVGLSFYNGKQPTAAQSRFIYGPYGILGFTPSFYLMTEWDFVNQTGQFGMANYNKLDYEFVKGFHVFLQQELGHFNFADSTTVNEVYGGGLQIFPRPHWELEGAYEKRRDSGEPYMIDYWYLMAHFYL